MTAHFKEDLVDVLYVKILVFSLEFWKLKAKLLKKNTIRTINGIDLLKFIKIYNIFIIP